MASNTIQHEDVHIAVELGTEIIKIRVNSGESEQSFIVHRAPLCKKIPYFNELIASKIEQGQIPEIRFLNDNPVAFKLLIGWVYSNDIKTVPAGDNNANFGLSEASQVLCLAGLAYSLDAGTLEDNAMSKLHKLYSGDSKERPTPAQVADAYKYAEEGSKIRLWTSRAILGWVSNGYRVIPSEEEKARYNRDKVKQALASNLELLGDFLAELQKHGIYTDPHDFPVCHCHQHASYLWCPYHEDKSGTSDRDANSQRGSHAGSDAGNDAGRGSEGDAGGISRSDVGNNQQSESRVYALERLD